MCGRDSSKTNDNGKADTVNTVDILEHCPAYNHTMGCDKYHLTGYILIIIDTINSTVRNHLFCYTKAVISAINRSNSSINATVLLGNTTVDVVKNDVSGIQDINSSISAEELENELKDFENSTKPNLSSPMASIALLLSDDSNNTYDKVPDKELDTLFIFGISIGNSSEKMKQLSFSEPCKRYHRQINGTEDLRSVGEELDGYACNMSTYRSSRCMTPTPTTALPTSVSGKILCMTTTTHPTQHLSSTTAYPTSVSGRTEAVSLGFVVGSVVGALILLAVIVVCLFCSPCKKRKNKGKDTFYEFSKVDQSVFTQEDSHAHGPTDAKNTLSYELTRGSTDTTNIESRESKNIYNVLREENKKSNQNVVSDNYHHLDVKFMTEKPSSLYDHVQDRDKNLDDVFIGPE